MPLLPWFMRCGKRNTNHGKGAQKTDMWLRTFSIWVLLVVVAGLVQPGCRPDSGEPIPADVSIVEYDWQALQAGNLGHECLEPNIEERTQTILDRMTLVEKIQQMHGDTALLHLILDDMSTTAGLPRLGIPPFIMADGPKGPEPSPSTTFPVGKARGATWDPVLEKRVGEVMGLEAKAKGANVLLAPTAEPVRHPLWGRTQETYGEDPLHVGRMAAAFISGVQQHTMASVKHFAANNIENTRHIVNVTMDERTLREIYLPSFKMAVQEAGVGSVMSAYNKVNGFYCGENPHLLLDILKGEWCFRGFVESDWFWGTPSTVGAANAGLDVEMPIPKYYGLPLILAVLTGEVPASKIEEAVRRILRQKFCFGLDTESDVDPSVVEDPLHIEVALNVARESIVLLKNKQNALPLSRLGIRRLALIGELADVANLGDIGSSNQVTPTVAVSPLDGLRQIAPSLQLVHIDSNILDDEQASEVAKAEAAVLVVGLTWRDEGENTPIVDPDTGKIVVPGDRDSLRLSEGQETLILRVAGLNPRTVVVLEGGGAIIVAPWIDEVEAVLMAWYPGMQGGQAIAEVLFGDVNPSGKLPVTFPRSEYQLPSFDNTSEEVEFGYDHGYRLADREGYDPQFPFGYGMSYTTFRYDHLLVSRDSIGPEETLKIHVDVTNTGTRVGEEIVQVYVSYGDSSVDRPVRDLKAFGRVALAPGQMKRFAAEVSARDLAFFDPVSGAWVVEPLEGAIWVGPSSRDLPLSASFRITAN